MNEGMQFTREGPSRETQISRGIFKRYLHGTRDWMRKPPLTPFFNRFFVLVTPMTQRQRRSEVSIGQ